MYSCVNTFPGGFLWKIKKLLNGLTTAIVKISNRGYGISRIVILMIYKQIIFVTF